MTLTFQSGRSLAAVALRLGRDTRRQDRAMTTGVPWSWLTARCVALEIGTTTRVTTYITKGSPLGDTLSLSCEASVGASGSNN